MNIEEHRKTIERHGNYLIAAMLISLAMLALLLKGLYWPAAHGLHIDGTQIGRDFLNVWVGPQFATHGQIATLFDLKGYPIAAGKLFGHSIPPCNWSYPPTALLLYYPFSVLPYFVSFGVWTVLGLISIAAVFRGYYPNKSLVLLAMICSPACIINLLSGQNGYFSAALLLGGLLIMRRHPIAAGILFGILTYKPQLGIVLPVALIAMRAWRTILAACVTTAIMTGLSIAVFGIGIWQHYFAETTQVQLYLLKNFDGLYSLMMEAPFAGFRRVGLSYIDALDMQAICSLIVLCLTYDAMRRITDIRRQALVIASAVPLLTPYLFNYDMVIMAIPLTAALWNGVYLPRREKYILLFAWIAPTITMVIGSEMPLFQVLAPLSFAGVFCLAITRDLTKQSVPETAVAV